MTDNEYLKNIERLHDEIKDLKRQLRLAQHNFEHYYSRYMDETGKTTAECEAEWEKTNPIIYGFPIAPDHIPEVGKLVDHTELLIEAMRKTEAVSKTLMGDKNLIANEMQILANKIKTALGVK